TWGQLGNGTATDAHTPVRARVGVPTRLSAGWSHTCALFAGGAVRCWGHNLDGELGNGRKDPWNNEQPHPLPVNVIKTPGVVWTSSNPTKATITDRGVATGLAVGNTTI